MVKELEQQINESVEKICETAFELLKGIENQTVYFRNEEYHYYSVEYFLTYKYKKMYIENGAVMVDYTIGMGIESFEEDAYTDALSTFELHQIQDIIRDINE